MDHGDVALEKLAQFHDLGVQFSVDDFGTGYSSLSYLQRFSYDTLKIDRSFISGMESKGDASAIVQTIVALANMLKINVVAEGVETCGAVRAAARDRLLARAGVLVLEAGGPCGDAGSAPAPPDVVAAGRGAARLRPGAWYTPRVRAEGFSSRSKEPIMRKVPLTLVAVATVCLAVASCTRSRSPTRRVASSCSTRS